MLASRCRLLTTMVLYPATHPTTLLCFSVCFRVIAGVWVLYRNRQEELLGGECTAPQAGAAPAAAPAIHTAPPTLPSPKGGLELALEQQDAAARMMDEARDVAVLPSATAATTSSSGGASSAVKAPKDTARHGGDDAV